MRTMVGMFLTIAEVKMKSIEEVYKFGIPDFRRLRLHEAIFKGFDGERVIGPAKIYLKPYWKEREVSYFEEEGW